MDKGISAEEACANSTIGTKEDFERLCNPDGTVKKSTNTTAVSLKNTDSSITVDNIYLQTGAAVLVIAAVVWIALAMRKRRAK